MQREALAQREAPGHAVRRCLPLVPERWLGPAVAGELQEALARQHRDHTIDAALAARTGTRFGVTD